MLVDYNSDYPSPAEYGWVNEDDLPNFDDTRDYLTGILEALYGTGNIESLEACLEELCHQYDLKFELGEPQLEVKNKNKPAKNILNEMVYWISVAATKNKKPTRRIER